MTIVATRSRHFGMFALQRRSTAEQQNTAARRPRGWVTPLLLRTPAGLMSRLLLAAAIIVPFIALALRALMIDAPWYTPELGLTVIVVVNVFFGAAIALGAGVILNERESDQEALRRSEELLRVAQRAGGIGHFCWDIQNNINTWSDELVALYGLPPGGFDGQYESWRKRIVPDDLPAAEAQIRNSLTSGEFSCDFRIVWPDASTHWMHASAKVLFSDDGKPLRMVGVNMDITERKQAEEALRNREDTLQRTFDVIPVGLWFADKNGKILRGNPAGVKIWGAEPAVGPSEYGVFKARRLPSGEEVAADDWALAHVIRDKVTIVDELLEIDAFDGRKKTIVNYAAPVLDAQGDLQGVIVINQDVTERRQAEEAVQLARERLQTLSHRLLEIQETERRKAARELHDEIGQALTAIKITLQSLQRYPEPTAIADRLGESVAIVERALGQVRSLSLELRPPLLDDLGLGPALRWLVDQHAGRAGLGVDFRNSVVDARFDTAVETACFRVAQEALNNVVRHAGAQHVTVEVHLQDDGLHLRVSDDGAGFDVPDAHRRAAQGASLGLLGMEERATLAGGGIEWRSAPGQGAEVHAWFPLPPPAGTSDETTATA